MMSSRERPPTAYTLMPLCLPLRAIPNHNEKDVLCGDFFRYAGHSRP